MFFYVFTSSSLAYKLLLPPFRHRVLLFHKSNMFCFLPCHLSLARCFLSCHCPSAMSFFLADLLLCHLWHLDILVHSNSDTFQNSMFLCLFLCRRLAPRDPRFAGLLFLSPRNQKFNRLSSISLLTASIFSSSLFMPNLFSNLFVSLTNVLKMSSNCSTSLALSRSETSLISGAYAEYWLSDVFL